MLVFAFLVTIAVVYGQVPPENCPPGLLIDHCNTQLSGFECFDPPFVPTKMYEMGYFPNNAVMNIMGWHSSHQSDVYVAGQGAGSGEEGREFYESKDGGHSFFLVPDPAGTSNAMAVNPSGAVVVGSIWQNQTDSGIFPAYSYYRSPGASEWISSDCCEGFREHVKSVGVVERGAKWKNNTWYLVALVTHDIVPPTPEDPWSEMVLMQSSNGVQWTYSTFPADLVPENMGIYEVEIIDDLRMVAIGGVHYGMNDAHPDYLGYILYSTDGGNSWTRSFFTEYEWTFTDLFCVDGTSTCYASAMGLGTSGALQHGHVLKSTNGGQSWSSVLDIYYGAGNCASCYAHLWHVHCLDANTCYAQGDYWGGLLVIYVTVDGGNTWNIAFDPNCQDRHYVHDVYDVDNVFHMLVQEPDVMQTGVIRMDFPPSIKNHLNNQA
eukprot:c11994_g1_i1.p1 GENE.c11994_g1_i1~~c11994_g1_i1.p1  ORF type:complete len:459 (-),score=16.76 c11994_g1_i1:44-1345(-)